MLRATDSRGDLRSGATDPPGRRRAPHEYVPELARAITWLDVSVDATFPRRCQAPSRMAGGPDPVR